MECLTGDECNGGVRPSKDFYYSRPWGEPRQVCLTAETTPQVLNYNCCVLLATCRLLQTMVCRQKYRCTISGGGGGGGGGGDVIVW